MRIAWLVWLVVGCGDDRERAPVTPPPVTPPSPDARLAPPPGDAPLALATHRFIRVKDFSEAAHPGWMAIEMPGLPAYDPTTKRIAVGRVELSLLNTTQPNVEIWLLDPARKGIEPLRVWSQEESFAVRGIDRSPEKLRALVLAMDERVTEIEGTLGAFTPIPSTCVGSDPPPEPMWFPPCDGREIWTCGDTVLRHPRTTRTGRRELLIVERGGKTARHAVAKWIKDSYRVPFATGGYDEQEMIACIHGAWVVPGTTDVLVEIAHACNTSGDMCIGGSHTFELVHPPT